MKTNKKIDQDSAFSEIINIFKEKINILQDLDAILEAILFHARQITNSDAGTIFLYDNEKLTFRYVQNDTLFSQDLQSSRFLYSNHSIPLDKKSIAGYTGITKKSLIIEDAYNISKEFPFTFNSDFDKSSGYTTKSILSVPILGSENQLIGVLQLINPTINSSHVKFNSQDLITADFFASQASQAIEKSILTRDLILRMIRMARLRDPKETGAHVHRVASYAMEIYRSYARKNAIPQEKQEIFRDRLRLAAMLHDVGKVAIPDQILKKPGKLTDEEFFTMKSHTLAGDEMIGTPVTSLDEMAKEIALRHHERWDGRGYPGKNPGSFESPKFGEGLKENEIPLSARIVSIADVYDALCSRRSYKEAWDTEKVLTIISEEKGKQFDPELVDIFLSIKDVINSIREKYSDNYDSV